MCNEDGIADFICNTGYTEMLSGLKNTYDLRHKNRVIHENRINHVIPSEIKVETKRVETICDEHNIQHIHYLSIDVEGAEFSVIQSINFDKVFIDIIGFENNYDDISIPIVQYLNSKGFVLLRKSLDIFMVHKDSQFVAKNV